MAGRGEEVAVGGTRVREAVGVGDDVGGAARVLVGRTVGETLVGVIEAMAGGVTVAVIVGANVTGGGLVGVLPPGLIAHEARNTANATMLNVLPVVIASAVRQPFALGHKL